MDSPAASSAKKARKEKKESPSEEPAAAAAAAGPTFISPIAKPLAGKKMHKNIFKAVRKATEAKMLKRGVKEVVKALRKGTKGLCVLAGDISPMDVISHLPVFCEELGVHYVFVTSKAELGEAAKTKRPTSCVLLTKEAAGADRFAEIVDEVKGLDFGIA